jgi:hypothetical protein
MEPLAGLAAVSLRQGDQTQARAYIQQVLNHLARGNLNGADDPFRVYLTCYQVLAAVADPQAATILQQARQQLQDRAAKLPSETLRRSFLEHIPAHRELMRLT